MSNTSATPHSDKVVGHKLFGPDFSLDVFKGTQAANWMKRLFPNLIVAILGADTGESDALSPGGRSPQTPATGKETTPGSSANNAPSSASGGSKASVNPSAYGTGYSDADVEASDTNEVLDLVTTNTSA